MNQNNRRGDSRTAPLAPGHNVPLAVTISIKEIYQTLCPACKAALLDLLEGKAAGQGLREAFRAGLEPPARLEGPEDRRRERD